MVWFIVIAIVIVIAARYLFSFKAKVRDIAKTQLRTYQTIKTANPSSKTDDLYKQVITSRTGFQDKVEYIYGLASQLKEQRDGTTESWDVNFMWIVMAMCVVETSGNTRASGKRLTTIYNATRAVIPDNL